MKRLFFFLVITISYLGAVNAQISRQTFEKAVDYANCKYIEYSLKRNQKDQDAFKKQCNCDGLPSFEIILNSIPSKGYDRNKSVAEEIDKVKSLEYRQSMEPTYLVNLLTDSIFSNPVRYKVINEFAEKRQSDRGFTVLKKDLKSELRILIMEDMDKTRPTEEQFHDLQQRLQDMEETPARQTSWIHDQFARVNIPTIILLLILTIVFVIVKRKKPSIFVPLENQEKPHNKNISQLERKIKHLENRVETCQEKISELKENDRNLQKSISTLNELLNPLQEPEQNEISENLLKPSPDKVVQKTAKSKIFYMHNPTEDGRFIDTSKTDHFKETRSIFMFEMIEEGRASFKIAEEIAPDLRSRYINEIEQACTPAENSPPYSPGVRIENDKPGIAERQGGFWIVKTKAQIRYES